MVFISCKIPLKNNRLENYIMELKMKKVIFVSSLLAALVGCSSTPPAPVVPVHQIPDYREESAPIKDPVQNRVTCKFAQVPDFEAHAMNRTEVIQATEQCQNAGLKPFVEYVTQKTDYGRVLTPVNVHCIVAKGN